MELGEGTVTVQLINPAPHLTMRVALKDEDGNPVAGWNGQDKGQPITPDPFPVPKPGRYFFMIRSLTSATGFQQGKRPNNLPETFSQPYSFVVTQP